MPSPSSRFVDKR